ncbi:MAG: response regulator [Bacteroidetes bacterium]|nr:response regulator [Bacteroidota bacterium]MBS1633155.1 response regulator [Bacteroidota bacterium]
MKREKLLILIVDDNLNFIKRVINLIEEQENIGYINVAHDYEQALKFIEEEKPDLVLLDINLPGKSGIELLRKIKGSGSECEVIMITNHADDYYKKVCRDLGADYFLDKSIEFSMLPEIIGNIQLK